MEERSRIESGMTFMSLREHFVIAGLTRNLRSKIMPVRVDGFDKGIFPRPFPIFELFFSLDSLSNIREDFKIDKFMAVVFLGKDTATAFGVFGNTTGEVVGNAYV